MSTAIPRARKHRTNVLFYNPPQVQQQIVLEPVGSLEGLMAKHLLADADKGYDSNAIVEQAINQGMKPVIPPKRNRALMRRYDKPLY